MKDIQPLIQGIRELAEAKDLDSMKYVVRFVNREIDKITIMGAEANPHPPGYDEGAESEHCLTAG